MSSESAQPAQAVRQSARRPLRRDQPQITGFDWRSFILQLALFAVAVLLLLIPGMSLLVMFGSLILGGVLHAIPTAMQWNQWHFQQVSLFVMPALGCIFATWHAIRPGVFTLLVLMCSQAVIGGIAWVMLGWQFSDIGSMFGTSGGGAQPGSQTEFVTMLYLLVYLMQAAGLSIRVVNAIPMTRSEPPTPGETALAASYAAFCPDCGTQVHARGGLCLYCGGVVSA